MLRRLITDLAAKVDWKTALIVGILSPVLLHIGRRIAPHVKTGIATIVDALVYALTPILRRSISARLSLRRYCKLQLAGQSRFLHVPSRFETKLDIDKTFVHLSLQHQGVGQVFSDDALLESHEIGNRVRVIGDPGSGKSSLLKKLLRSECTNALKESQKARLPILIELRNLNAPQNLSDDQAGVWLMGHIRQVVSKTAVFQITECFENYCVANGLLVLLDGLDEVPRSSFQRIFGAIIGLSQELENRSPKNLIVLTMRIQFHNEIRELFRDSFGSALIIRPFTPSDVYEFLQRWPFKAATHASVARIYRDLADRPTIREICSNPLILAMYVAEEQIDDGIPPPNSRTEFFKSVVDELILKRRLKQTGAVSARAALEEQREEILGELALEHLLNPLEPANSLSFEAAVRITRAILKCDDECAQSAFRDICKETGIVGEEQSGQTLRFLHLTFCEYLAATQAVRGRRNGWKELVSSQRQAQAIYGAESSRLVEVISFSAGLIPRSAREEAIRDVAGLGNDTLLTKCFIETKHFDTDLWTAFINKRKSILLTKEWEDDWAREMQLLSTAIAYAEECSKHLPNRTPDRDLQTFFQEFLVCRPSELRRMLSVYATHDAAAAFRFTDLNDINLPERFPEIVVNNCDQPAFLALAVERAIIGQSDTWAILLIDSAYRSRAVMRHLLAYPEVESVKETVNRAPASKNWVRSGLVGSSLFYQLLTLALVSDKDVRFGYSFGLVKNIQVPQLLLSHLVQTAMLLTNCAIASYCIPAIPLLLNKEFDMDKLLVPGIAFACSYLLFYFQLSAAKLNRKVYKAILTADNSRISGLFGSPAFLFLPSSVRLALREICPLCCT